MTSTIGDGYGKSYPIDLFMDDGDRMEAMESEELSRSRRGDGREFEEYRPICINADASASADGSAYAELGNTKLYCTVCGPHEIIKSDTSSDSTRRAVLNVKVAYAPFAFPWRIQRKRGEQEISEERSYSAALMDAFSAVIMLEKYPKSQIDLTVTVIEDDGGVLPLALMACSVALTNAGIETYDVVVAASLMISDGRLIVDPTRKELSRPVEQTTMNRAEVTYGVMPSLNQVICMNQIGQLKATNFSQATKLLSECCYQLCPIVQQSISKWIRRANKDGTKMKK